MTKDDNGVWSVTAGPLKPELWMYNYTVDGTRAIDPRNVNTARDGANYLSTFFVNGPGAAPYQVTDIPHGSLNIDWYASASLKLTRRVFVYTPPGYRSGTTRYPVLYLLHGGGGDEEAWTSMGRTPQILDYLIAQGKAKPMIVVMTNGNADQAAAQNLVPPAPRAGGASSSPTAASVMAFPESLVADVVPYIDKTYRTLADRQNRAIAGLSMGGMHTASAALTHPDTFAWVGCFSGAYPVWPGARKIVEMGTVAPTRSGPGKNERLNMEAVDKLFPEGERQVGRVSSVLRDSRPRRLRPRIRSRLPRLAQVQGHSLRERGNAGLRPRLALLAGGPDGPRSAALPAGVKSELRFRSDRSTPPRAPLLLAAIVAGRKMPRPAHYTDECG